MRFKTILILIVLTFNLSCVFAATQIPLNSKNSNIKISIKYSVVGQYKAVFDQYEGVITLGESPQDIQAVELNIQAASINSGFKGMDNVVRSKQLLDTARIPLIQFKSASVVHDDSGYQVIGILTMHGISKEYTFPFSVDQIVDANDPNKKSVLKGKWVVNRKDFGIIWNKLLDHGGVLVGDYITVNWEVRY